MFVRIVLGIFMVLHGLVHLLYFGHGLRFFELPDLAWPDDSWAFGWLPGVDSVRRLAAGANVLAMLGFVAGGVGVLAVWSWWQPVAVGSAVFSTAIWLLFWDGTMQRLAEQGLVAIVINAAILFAVLVYGVGV
jgi:hypothetical protein